MSEYRYDPYYGIWVAIATIRGERPHDFQQSESRVADARCPFCRGEERETPPAVLELAAIDAPTSLVNGEDDGWVVRVVPNKFPAISGDDGWIGQGLEHKSPAKTPVSAGPRDRGSLQTPNSPYSQKMVGGCQEILIESPRHVASLSELTKLERLLTLRAMQERIRVGQADPTVQQISVFKNCRSEAGASLEHAHSQLIFSRFASAAIQQRWANCQAFWDQHQSSLIQTICKWEMEDNLSRVVAGGDGYLAFCPYASRFPFQVWIVPDAEIGPFEQAELAALEGLSEHLRDAIARLEKVHPQAPYNVLLHLPPPRFDAGMTPAAHSWFMEIIPRLGRLAGYELMGAGWVNEAPPERAAQQLRAAGVLSGS